MRSFRLLAIALLTLTAQVTLARADPATQVAQAARKQVGVTVQYDPSYVRMAYPGGDVAADRGVCSDVVVRAYRAVDVDLQQLLHEDMRGHFAAYPNVWRMAGPDSNIDHRRVANLQRYFERHGKALPVTDRAGDYRPGDIVSWRLPNGLAHIGIVSDRSAGGSMTPLVVHNIGRGAQEEDVLFAWPQTGHYRWFAANESSHR